MKNYFFGDRLSLFDFVAVTMIVKLIGESQWLAAIALAIVTVAISGSVKISEAKSDA